MCVKRSRFPSHFHALTTTARWMLPNDKLKLDRRWIESIIVYVPGILDFPISRYLFKNSYFYLFVKNNHLYHSLYLSLACIMSNRNIFWQYANWNCRYKSRYKSVTDWNNEQSIFFCNLTTLQQLIYLYRYIYIYFYPKSTSFSFLLH